MPRFLWNPSFVNRVALKCDGEEECDTPGPGKAQEGIYMVFCCLNVAKDALVREQDRRLNQDNHYRII